MTKIVATHKAASLSSFDKLMSLVKKFTKNLKFNFKRE